MQCESCCSTCKNNEKKCEGEVRRSRKKGEKKAIRDTLGESSQQTVLLLSILFHKEYTTQMLVHLEASEGRVGQRKHWRESDQAGHSDSHTRVST